ncbi:hypothetical protein [Deinococcus sp.]|uniref:hypothetical protein n=1 Tax=Deinococcus sp. TaxID=47478 RepID=UPI003C7A0719
MFNLTVGEAHTFYVGAVGWLVHNFPDAGAVKNLFDLPPSAKIYKSESAMQDLFARLEKFNGIDPKLASERLHKLKLQNGFGGADNVVVDATGNVFNPKTGEAMGSLTQGGAKK